MDSRGSIVDATVYISPSAKLKEYLCQLQNVDNLPESITRFIKTIDKKEVKEENDDNADEKTEKEEIPDKKDVNELLTITDIEWLFKHLNEEKNDGEVLYLHELFEGSDIILPENEVIKRNPDLEARCDRLRKQQMNRAYRAMTKNVDNVRIKQPKETIAYQIKHLNKQLIAVAQFIISLGAGFLFGFLGIELLIGNLDFGFRLLLGVICALIIALAEIYFLAKKLNEELYINDTVQLGGPTVYPNDKKPHMD